MTTGRLGAVIAAAMAIMSPLSACSASIDEDETLLLFPTAAHHADSADAWEIPIHGWVFEGEGDSLWRSVLVAQAAVILGLDRSATENALFRQRAWMFLVDNERQQTVDLRIGPRDTALGPTGADGHARALVSIDRAELADTPENGWVRVEALLASGDPRRFAGEAQLLERAGISVISDIDDTIKISDVTDRQALLANTFLREFRPVPGMPDLYGRWAASGAAFHYVSSSPWQLYPALAAFLDGEGFPRGSFDLRQFRLKDESFFDLFQESDAYKVPAIAAIVGRYPGRRFILVGDSGERDPEVYGEIARRFPEQVVQIFIRDIFTGAGPVGRMDAAFAGIPQHRWTVFRNPEELAGYRWP